ncbi:plasmid partitioning protein [Streptomyces misionensis]|uniref:ParB/RepB/Spo0J family partition protein n=1 Tax=Streptomyces misionensis TaxID=67331 RepID=UPI0036C2C022
MSIADRLGTGSSFSQAPRGRSARGRAKAVTQGDLPAYELVRLRLEDISPTPLNPRRNFGTDEEKTRFGEELRQAQLAACVAVTRGAYLALWPEHTDRIANASHVLINGERRFHSAVHVGLEALDFVVRDDLATTREEFVNYLLQENLEREDFDVIERARGVQQLVSACAEQSERGARSRAAERLKKARSWVTNQLALLELPQEIQVMLSAGTLPERDGRTLVRYCREDPGMDAAALLERLEAEKEAAAKVKADERAQLAALRHANGEGLFSADNNQRQGDTPSSADEPGPGSAEGASGLFSADNNLSQAEHGQVPAATPEPREPTAVFSADNNQDASARPEAAVPKQPSGPGAHSAVTANVASSSPSEGQAPEPAADNRDASVAVEGDQVRRLPYDDAFSVVKHMHVKMTAENFVQGARVWMKTLREHHPEDFKALLLELSQQDQPA